MNKLAFIFPGQGSQTVGMGRALFDRFFVARETIEDASEVLGYDLKSIIFSGPPHRLNMTENTQPALLAVSVAALRVIEQTFDLKPSFLAGHSLGEYTALVAAGALEFEQALKIVHLRGKFMQESVPEGNGKMCAVLGLDLKMLKQVCSDVSSDSAVVVPANINSREQVVLSGDAIAVERAAEIALDIGAKRIIELPVSVPSHSPLMKPAAERLAKELKKAEIGELSLPVVTNVEARPLTDRTKVKRLLVRQLTSPVRWLDIINTMRESGVDTTIEIGSGKVLSGLVRRIDRDIKTLKFGVPEDLDALKEAFGGN